MISVKDFAASHNKSLQAVYQQMKRKKNASLLEGHVEIINGIKYLDDEAVAILEAGTDTSPAIVMTENKDERIKELEAANKLLLEKMDKIHEKYEAVIEWKAANVELIAQAEKQQQLLEVNISNAVKEAEDKLAVKHNEAVSKLKNHYAEEINDLQKQLQEERNKSWLDKLLGR